MTSGCSGGSSGPGIRGAEVAEASLWPQEWGGRGFSGGDRGLTVRQAAYGGAGGAVRGGAAAAAAMARVGQGAGDGAPVRKPPGPPPPPQLAALLDDDDYLNAVLATQAPQARQKVGGWVGKQAVPRRLKFADVAWYMLTCERVWGAIRVPSSHQSEACVLQCGLCSRQSVRHVCCR